MAPPLIDSSSSLIIFFSSKYWITPNPSHFSQAPKGLLNENILGSNSGTEYPHFEHAKLDENETISFLSINSISTIPSERFNAVSRDSASLNLRSSSSLSINLSTTALMLCF